MLFTDIYAQIETFGEDHAQSASTMVALGDVFEANGEYAKAMHYFNKALPIQEAHLGKEHSAPTKTALKLVYRFVFVFCLTTESTLFPFSVCHYLLLL